MLLCSPTATGTAVQLGARTPLTAPRPTWDSAAPPPPRGHADMGTARAGSHPRKEKCEHCPLLMTHSGITWTEVPAEGRKASMTQQCLENLGVHEQPGLDLNPDRSVLDSAGTKLSRNMPIMFSEIT